MAISKIAEPEDFSPAYNPLVFQYDSTNNNEDGFKYIFDVYESGTANKIGEYRVFPRITDGYGHIDLSPLLRTKVTFTKQSGTQDDVATDSFYKYDVKVGEEYIVAVAYTASLTNSSGNVKITATHSYQVGDQVVISQADSGVANPQLEGLHTVIAINTTVDFTVSALWSDVTDATINGSVKYADNRKTITRDVVTESNKYVFNGAFKHNDWSSYDSTKYILTANTDKFITYQPQNFYITPTQEVFFNLSTNGTTTGFIVFQNDGGDILKYAANANSYVYQANVGATANPSTVVSGTAGHIKSDTVYYDVWYTNAGGTQHSLKYRFYIDRRCAIEDYYVLFLDRLGSMSSFAFQLRAYERGNITRDSYNQRIEGSVSSSKWNYSNEEYGMRTYKVGVEKTLELNTNWMTEDMAEYFEQLLTSPVTYFYDGREYLPCTITDTSFEVERQRNKNLIRKTITIKYANQDAVNV
jgi:hypothetical protein